jgi:putative acyl-CoA dehydrogenase
MSPLRPTTLLQTHDVVNQPPPFENVSLFTTDRALQAALAAAGGSTHAERLASVGARTGSGEVQEWAAQANRNPPQFRSFDRFGARLDEVEFHPAYHLLMALGLEAGIASVVWGGVTAGHVLRTALEFLMAQAEPGVCCLMTMTYATGVVLRRQPGIPLFWAEKIATSRYASSSRPAPEK